MSPINDWLEAPPPPMTFLGIPDRSSGAGFGLFNALGLGPDILGRQFADLLDQQDADHNWPGALQLNIADLPPDHLAQVDLDRKNQCIAECVRLVLSVPRRLQPFTWDQCMAHCEGKSFFPQVQPYIRHLG